MTHYIGQGHNCQYTQEDPKVINVALPRFPERKQEPARSKYVKPINISCKGW